MENNEHQKCVYALSCAKYIKLDVYHELNLSLRNFCIQKINLGSLLHKPEIILFITYICRDKKKQLNIKSGQS